MRNLKRIIGAVLMLSVTNFTNGQVMGGLLNDDLYKTRVKLVDEFFDRFNGKESRPDIKTDSEDAKLKNLLVLFNGKMFKSMEDSAFVEAKTFAEKVIQDSIILHYQDSTWIEQLKTKREDLGLDFIIATTTRRFTKGAINKAKYHGIIIEEAELFDKNLIDTISDEFFFDLLFIRYEVEYINFLTKDGRILSLKEIISNLDLISQMEFINVLNLDFYALIEPNSIIENSPFSKDDFFNNSKDSCISGKYDLYFKDNSPNIIKKLNLAGMYAIIKLIPLKFSLPLNKSLSIFNVAPRNNKKYSAYFGNEEEYLKIGYLDNKRVVNELKLKERPYCRFVGANLHINTIFPCDISNYEINMDEIMQKGIGKFDFSKVLK